LFEGRENGTFSERNVPFPHLKHAVRSGDFDEDGRSDLVILTDSATQASLLLANGDGTFRTTPIEIPFQSLVLAAGDVNADGHQDIVVGAVQGGGSFETLLGLGNGAFYRAGSSLVLGGIRSVELADVDRDGALDLLAVAPAPVFFIARGTSTGSFEGPRAIELDAHADRIRVADVDGDGYAEALLNFDYGRLGTENRRIAVMFLAPGGDVSRIDMIDGKSQVMDFAVTDWGGDGVRDLMVSLLEPAPYGGDVTVFRGKGGGRFQGPVTYGLDLDQANSVASGDFNRDGKLDLVGGGSSYKGPAFSLLLGNGDGTLQPPRRIVTDQPLSSIGAADFNRDGVTDVVGLGLDSGIYLLLGDGLGGFAPARQVVPPGSARELAVGDFTGNGIPDIAVRWRPIVALVLLSGRGDGTFEQSALDNEAYGENLTVADMNRDGRDDLVVMSGRIFQVAFSTSRRRFSAGRKWQNGAESAQPAVGDFDGDRIPDLAIPGIGKGKLTIYRGDGLGGFVRLHRYKIGPGAYSAAATDLNRDGKTDLVVTRNPSGVMILWGNGRGGFTPGSAFATGVLPRTLTLGDFDQDGSKDLGVLCYRSPDVSILPSSCGE
jgi:hypothetical protein